MQDTAEQAAAQRRVEIKRAIRDRYENDHINTLLLKANREELRALAFALGVSTDDDIVTYEFTISARASSRDAAWQMLLDDADCGCLEYDQARIRRENEL